jgi:integrase
MPVPRAWTTPVEDYRLFLIAGGQSLETARLRVGWVRRFARAVDVGPWDVTDEMVIRWSAGHTWSAETRRSAHDSVRGFYTWATRAGRCEAAPRIPSVRRSIGTPHPADDRSVDLALSSSDPRVVLMVRLAAEAGLRRGEVARVHSRDLVSDLLGRSLVVHGKGGKDRVVPLTESLADAVASAGAGWVFPGQDHGHLSPAWVGKLVGRALPAGVTMHALRHRFASYAYAETTNLVGVQRLLGHSSPDTTLRYVLVPDATLRTVVEAVAQAYVRAA